MPRAIGLAGRAPPGAPDRIRGLPARPVAGVGAPPRRSEVAAYAEEPAGVVDVRAELAFVVQRPLPVPVQSAGEAQGHGTAPEGLPGGEFEGDVRGADERGLRVITVIGDALLVARVQVQAQPSIAFETPVLGEAQPERA